ncbi:50S ribosomal protein L5 [Candidatus Woesearchaeota archaeon]|nr:50S ribosomal protein L5 [Candidatus Woesearchaeota archaeon]
MNIMREIKVEKITLNIGVGAPGEKLEKAMKLLKNITGLKPVPTSSNKRIPTWGVRPNLNIACKVTVRGKNAEKLLVNLLSAADNKLSRNKFDKFGNFSFGIPEYIDIPDVQYDASIGVIGLEVAVTLGRPGFRIGKRSIRTRKIPMKHRITTDDAVNFMKDKFGIVVGEEE